MLSGSPWSLGSLGLTDISGWVLVDIQSEDPITESSVICKAVSPGNSRVISA